MDMVPLLVGDEYRVEGLEGSEAVLALSGTMRFLSTADSEAFRDCIIDMHNAVPDAAKLTIDLRSLKALNSQGITTLSRFVIYARTQRRIQLTFIRAAADWQGILLANITRLWPEVHVQTI